jgi:hypothetical protein
MTWKGCGRSRRTNYIALVTRLQAGDRRVFVRFPAGARNSPQLLNERRAPTACYTMSIGGPLSREQSLSLTAEVKNVRSKKYTPPIRLHDKIITKQGYFYIYTVFTYVYVSYVSDISH